MSVESKRIQYIANIGITVVVLILAGIAIKQFYGANQRQDMRPQSAVEKREPVMGTKVSLPGINWSENNQTLIVALQKGCHYCAESAPFYQEIARERAKNPDIKVIAVLPQSVVDSTKYLEGLKISVDRIAQSDLALIGVRGTPTLLLVNDEGVVTKEWVGRLSPERENEVFAELQLNRASK